MKKIFIAAHYMEIGGAEISLIGLLQAIDYSKYDVDLFIYCHSGELMSYIPKKVNLLPENVQYAAKEKPLRKVLFSKAWKIGIARLICKYKYWSYRRIHPCTDSFVVYQITENVLYRYLPSLKKYGEYDLALNFIADTALVLDKVKAKKKVTWIHSDYSSFEVDPQLSLHWFNRVDCIVSISDAATETFLRVYPSLKDKIITIENILSPAFVRSRAEEFDAIDEQTMLGGSSVKILSIGRYSPQKNFDNVPDICRRIIEYGVDIRWFLIGYGGDEDLIRQKIKEAGMEKHVIILGKRSNPYPYIKACDIYVQPSRYEGKSVTVREAQILCKPVIVTNYATAVSQIKNNIDGIIVPMDNESCAEGILNFMQNTELRNSIVKYLHQHDYGNMEEVYKIYQLL